VHANFSVEKNPDNRNTQSFVDFDKNSVSPFLIVIHRRLKALSTPFYIPFSIRDISHKQIN
jgi:hypothetical protein